MQCYVNNTLQSVFAAADFVIMSEKFSVTAATLTRRAPKNAKVSFIFLYCLQPFKGRQPAATEAHATL